MNGKSSATGNRMGPSNDRFLLTLTQPSKHTGDGVGLKEEDRMLACIWWEGRNLACALRKIVGIGRIHRQANLAIVVENDSISLLKTEWLDDCSALGAANTALSCPFDTAGGPRYATPGALLINERIVAKGRFVRHHRTRRGCQR